jgi:hypothetical protein
MAKVTDIRPISATLYFLPVATRVPLKFGPETLTSVTCARACVTVSDSRGQVAEGWGETPLSVQWVWPSARSYSERHETLQGFCMTLAQAWADFDETGHPIEVGHAFQTQVLRALLDRLNRHRERATEPMPSLAALVCCSPFDLALHDAYGVLHRRAVYETYGPRFMSHDLAHFLDPATRSSVSFVGKYPADFLVSPHPDQLPAWHLVGGLDPLDPSDLAGDEPDDGYPVTLLSGAMMRAGTMNAWSELARSPSRAEWTG